MGWAKWKINWVVYNPDPQSPPLTIGGTVLNASDDIVILRVTFGSKMSFEKRLHSVSKAASQRLGILRKSWLVFHDRSLLGRCFRGFVLPVLEYCSAVWCSAADTHLKLLHRAVRGAQFPTGGVFECDIAHYRSLAEVCMLYKMRCNPMHLLNGGLTGLYMPVQVTCAALVIQQYTYAPPHCRTSQYSRTFIPVTVSLCNDLANLVFNGVWLAGFKSSVSAFFLA